MVMPAHHESTRQKCEGARCRASQLGLMQMFSMEWTDEHINDVIMLKCRVSDNHLQAGENILLQSNATHAYVAFCVTYIQFALEIHNKYLQLLGGGPEEGCRAGLNIHSCQGFAQANISHSCHQMLPQQNLQHSNVYTGPSAAHGIPQMLEVASTRCNI